jgi:NAD(P)-dependent dehydrogenase (short-subunit alcohol dehydrogenase family)
MTIEKTNERVVLVTGAAKRLGREIVLACAKAGWRVAVHYNSSEADAIKTIADCAHNITGTAPFPLNSPSNPHAKFQADLGDEAATRRLAAQVIAHMGRLDAVVNSAALFEHDDANSFSYAALQKHLASNTGAAIVLAQALHAHVASRQEKEDAQGVVINMLDQKLWNQNPDFLSYTLSKAALEAANTMLAIGLAPQLRVVGIAPGLTLTSHMLSDEQFQALHKLSPLQRSSTPEDVCAAVLFAMTNRSITGTTLLVDGGQHLMKFERDFSLM